MTAKEAAEAGYEVTKASTCEVGLSRNGKGIRTWWCQDFGKKLPPLDHPEIMKTIERDYRNDGKSGS